LDTATKALPMDNDRAPAPISRNDPDVVATLD
jgi:hypothetical protein